jgi:plastocyanin
MKFTTISLIAAMIAPALAAKTWDIHVVNGLFPPQVLKIELGDSVRWSNNDDVDYSIVETTSRRGCNNKPSGFNSGRMTKGQAYQQLFPAKGTYNYKNGIARNCEKGTTGTIKVSPRRRPPRSQSSVLLLQAK